LIDSVRIGKLDKIMVLGLVDTLLYTFTNPLTKLNENSLENHLTAEGFNGKESSDIAYLINHRGKGDLYGGFAGVAIAYLFNTQLVGITKRYS